MLVVKWETMLLNVFVKPDMKEMHFQVMMKCLNWKSLTLTIKLETNLQAVKKFVKFHLYQLIPVTRILVVSWHSLLFKIMQINFFIPRSEVGESLPRPESCLSCHVLYFCSIGPFSECRENNGQAICTCLQGYIGSPPQCRPECVTSPECPSDKGEINISEIM